MGSEMCIRDRQRAQPFVDDHTPVELHPRYTRVRIACNPLISLILGLFIIWSKIKPDRRSARIGPDRVNLVRSSVWSSCGLHGPLERIVDRNQIRVMSYWAYQLGLVEMKRLAPSCIHNRMLLLHLVSFSPSVSLWLSSPTSHPSPVTLTASHARRCPPVVSDVSAYALFAWLPQVDNAVNLSSLLGVLAFF